MSDEELEGAYTLSEIDNLIKEEFEKEFKGYKRLENDEKSIYFDYQSKLDSEKSSWVGPFTASAQRIVLRRDERILISNGDGGLAVGVYFCDVITYRARISLPSNAVGRVDVPTPSGYNNLTDLSIGITTYQNTGPSGTELVAETTTIFVKYNLLGQTLNRTIPNNLQDGFPYTYYYITF